jgi:hypothetical protein
VRAQDACILFLFLVLTGGRGNGRVRVSCVNEEDWKESYSSSEQTLSLEDKDPVGLYRMVWRLTNFTFLRPGVYVVRFLFEDEEVDNRIVSVR